MDGGGGSGNDRQVLKRAFLVELEQQQQGAKVYCRAKHRYFVPVVPTLPRAQEFTEVPELSNHAYKLLAAKGLARPTRAQQWLLPAIASGYDIYAGERGVFSAPCCPAITRASRPHRARQPRPAPLRAPLTCVPSR